MSECIRNRYDFVVLFDVENGNPNGDPDAGNMPRIDPETGCGLVTDVCLKRKIRNYVEMVKEGDPRYRHLYQGKRAAEPQRHGRALAECGYPRSPRTGLKELKKKDKDIDAKLLDYMCGHYFDIRTFGAVMTTFVKGALNCGQVRGPVQLGFARSVDPIMPQEVTITRVAITTEADADEEGHRDGPQVHRALRPVPRRRASCPPIWRARPPASPRRTWRSCGQAILNMFENDHSAARGKMAVRRADRVQARQRVGQRARLEAV